MVHLVREARLFGAPRSVNEGLADARLEQVEVGQRLARRRRVYEWSEVDHDASAGKGNDMVVPAGDQLEGRNGGDRGRHDDGAGALGDHRSAGLDLARRTGRSV